MILSKSSFKITVLLGLFSISMVPVDDDLVVGAAEVAERLVLGPLRLPRGGLLLREPGDVLACGEMGAW